MNKLFVIGLLILIITCSFFVAGYYVMFDYQKIDAIVPRFLDDRSFEFMRNYRHDFTDSYTRAVCSGNICQDYSFTCKGGEIVSSQAISGFVTFDEDWIDLRDEKDIDKC